MSNAVFINLSENIYFPTLLEINIYYYNSGEKKGLSSLKDKALKGKHYTFYKFGGHLKVRLQSL